MTNKHWFCGLSLALAIGAIAFLRRETQARRIAALEQERIRQELADARVALRTVATVKPPETPKPIAGALVTAAPIRAGARVAATPVGEPANGAREKARKAAGDEALLRQRVRRLMDLEMKIRPKFQSLGLSEEQWNRYQILSLEKVDREEEAKRARKADQTPEWIEAPERAGDEIVAEIKALIGDSPFEELTRFQAERADPARTTVEALTNRLMFSNAPLESWQAEKLRQIFRADRSIASAPAEASGISNPGAIDIRSILTPPQLEYWRRLQMEQTRITDAAAISKRFESVKSASRR